MTVREFIETMQAKPHLLDLQMGDRYFEYLDAVRGEDGWMYFDATQAFVREGRVHVSGGGVPIGTTDENVLMPWSIYNAVVTTSLEPPKRPHFMTRTKLWFEDLRRNGV